MTQITPAGARIIDPVLTTQARGYKNPDVSRIGSVLFPRAPVNQRGAKIVKFGREAFRLYNTRRAPGANTKRIQVGYTDESVSLKQYSLEGVVPREILEESQRAGGPPVNMAMRAVDVPMEAIARDLEYRQAAIAQNTANYASTHRIALSTNEYWDDTDSDPGKQMDDAHQAIRSTTGRRGNVLVLGPNVYLKVRRHPKVVGHFYTGAQAGAQSVNDAQLAEYFRVARIAVGDDVYLPQSAAEDAPFSDVWGDVAILAYVPTVGGDGDIEVPSYGYTYYLAGHPAVEKAYFDNSSKSWVYPVTDENDPVLTGMGAGYLFTNVLTPA
jgi:hypothetical protein